MGSRINGTPPYTLESIEHPYTKNTAHAATNKWKSGLIITTLFRIQRIQSDAKAKILAVCFINDHYSSSRINGTPLY